MKLKIAYNEKNYTLSFTRATVKSMTKAAEKVDDEDTVKSSEVIIRASLRAEQPALSKNEADEVVDYIMNNCQLIDKKEDGETTEKGLLTYLNDMILECMPKGFTGQTATKGFTVVE